MQDVWKGSVVTLRAASNNEAITGLDFDKMQLPPEPSTTTCRRTYVLEPMQSHPFGSLHEHLKSVPPTIYSTSSVHVPATARLSEEEGVPEESINEQRENR